MNGPRTLRRPPGCADGHGHDPAKAATFRRHCTAELAGDVPQAAPGRLCAREHSRPVTLLTATRDITHSQPAVLAQLPQHPGLPKPGPVTVATGAGRVARLAGAGALLAMTGERILRGAAKERLGMI